MGTTCERFWLGRAPVATARQHGAAAAGAHSAPAAVIKLASVPGGSREEPPSWKRPQRNPLGRLKAWLGTLCRRKLPKPGHTEQHSKPTLETLGGSHDKVSGTCALSSPQLTTFRLRADKATPGVRLGPRRRIADPQAPPDSDADAGQPQGLKQVSAASGCKRKRRLMSCLDDSDGSSSVEVGGFARVDQC